MTEKLNHEMMQEVSINDLLEAGFDDIEKVKDFVLWPKGVFLFTLSKLKIESDGQGSAKKEFISSEFKLQEIVELVNQEDEAVVEQIVHAEQNLTFRFYKGYGIQEFMTRFEDAATALGAGNLGAMLQELPGQTIRMEVGHRKDKKSGEIYPKIVDVQLVE